MKQAIYYEFQEALVPIKESIKIAGHRAILSRMKVMLKLMKRKKKELDDMRHQSNSTQHRKTLYEKYNI